MSALSAFWYTVGAIATFSVGVAYAVTRRALADYRKTRADLPVARRSVLSSAWATVKAGALAALILLLLSAWVLHGRAQ